MKVFFMLAIFGALAGFALVGTAQAIAGGAAYALLLGGIVWAMGAVS